ncbi:MaoC/PaaZ C-terminal domain-containing protein [Serinicoccus kebangsaanensis]|uniref:MaoC/PaaZ C-terminal domain-containing protein n=1 Tax=Serinicoccus kebangsaanensis TaxID=2602069 RepID=UPI00124E0AAC|nr:MaoC/PaaZ C-terminal domain-containing protein [Serinicoccus kebangsaanensis]
MSAGSLPAPGSALPSRVRFTTRTQLVRYAGAAQDPSPIHFDDAYARERGFPSVIVHGFLKAGLLEELALTWAPAGSWLQQFSVRYRGIDLVGAPLLCQGLVTDVSDDGVVGLELWIEDEAGHRTTDARAQLRWEGRAA